MRPGRRAQGSLTFPVSFSTGGGNETWFIGLYTLEHILRAQQGGKG
jgi:hypothetical protein